MTETAAALDIARGLAAYGIPIFVAAPDPDATTGFRLPARWQQTTPDPRVVDSWRPGMALCAVTGCGLDLLDVDPRNGGTLDELAGQIPTSYGVALTPSGGLHSFVRALGVRSRDNVLPGVDVKAGDAQGRGRGFAFIAPTVRVSKVTGQPVAYRWRVAPDLEALRAAGEDRSGAALAGRVTAARGPRSGAPAAPGAPVAPRDPTVEAFMSAPAAFDWTRDPADVGNGEQNVDLFRAACSLRSRGASEADALAALYARVAGYVTYNDAKPWEPEDAERTWARVCDTYPDGATQGGGDGAGDPAGSAGAAGGDGDEGRPTEDHPQPNPARYYTPAGALLAKTLALDVIRLGPLANGTDNRTWSYQAGVWRADPHVVVRRVSWLMSERYRPSHARNAVDIVMANVGRIDCDPVPGVINFRNGLYDWKTATLLDHSPQVPSTVQLPVDHAAGADCPEFEKFLAGVLPADMLDTAWELIGYLMYSGNPLHTAVMLTGKGRNGKGTFIRTMVALLGRANVTTASLHDLVNTRFTTASLFGKLANLSGDIDAGYLESTATFKAITGGDMISAEHKGRDRFDYVPWAVPVFSANKVPQSADTTVGYLSRWLVVPFPNSFVGREDRFLDAKLTTAEELSGIAARGLEALPRLLERGNFELSESALAAHADFERRVDQVRTWLSDCADIHPEHPWVNRTELYQTYSGWALRDGHRPVRAHEFYDRIEAAGAEPAIVRGVRGFRRIKVTDRGGWYPQDNPPQGAAGAEGAGNPASPQGAKIGVQVEGAGRTSIRPVLLGTGGAAPETDKTDEGAGRTKIASAPAFSQVRGGNSDSRVQRVQLPPNPQVFDTTECSRKKLEVGGLPAPSAPWTPRILAAAGPLTELPALLDRDSDKIVPVDVRTAVLLLERARDSWTVDVETTGFPIGHPAYRLRTVQIGFSGFAIVFDAEDSDQADAVRQLLRGTPARLHAHSAVADLAPLDHAGLIDAEAAWSAMYDTVIPAKLSDPASTGSDPDLKSLAAHVLGTDAVSPAADKARSALFKAGKWLTDTKAGTPVERSGWAQVDKRCATMIRYAASDVLDTAALAERLPKIPDALYDRERAAQQITARVSHRGLALDGDRVRALAGEHRTARGRLGEQIRARGIDNPGSGAQVAAELTALGARLPRTDPTARYPNGQPSVRGEVLAELAHVPGQAGALAAELLDYRHHDKALSAFLEPYRQLVDGGDGRARPTIYTLAADTGRMSCVRPNLQQVPRQGGMRSCIVADPGQLLISADFAGVEIRVAAALSGDLELARVIAAHDTDPAGHPDVHTMIARQVFGPDATKEHRYLTKRGVFAYLYGAGVDKIARTLGITLTQAQAVIDRLAGLAPGLAQWSQGLVNAVQTGQLQTLTAYSGRIIHLPRQSAYAAVNYAIQGTARELLVDALLRWAGTRWGTSTVLPIHDEVLALVPEAEAADALAALVGCMETRLHAVEIKAEASEPSPFWKDAS